MVWTLYLHNLTSYSENYQDLFVLHLLNYQFNGKFVDIGSGHPISNSNTYLLENFNWTGVCVELDKSNIKEYSNRKCLFLNCDALILDYSKLFQYINYNKCIDYLSLDIDENTTDLLELIPFISNEYKIITIEHDSYRFGDLYKTKQRSFLENKGYKLMFGNVYAEKGSEEWGKERSYEDWWINPKYINSSFTKIENIYPSEIIKLIQANL